jgi:hypothetical protein
MSTPYDDYAVYAANDMLTRWQRALSNFGFPYDLVSSDKAEEMLAIELILGAQQGIFTGHHHGLILMAERRPTGRAAVNDGA